LNHYIIRLYHKDLKTVVMAVDPPVKVYYPLDSGPDIYYRPLFCMCWWVTAPDHPFYIMYNDRLVCRWGGEMVVKELPYERGAQSLM
jgi:hypothetical protein